MLALEVARLWVIEGQPYRTHRGYGQEWQRQESSHDGDSCSVGDVFEDQW
jgi:hypothetical protein